MIDRLEVLAQEFPADSDTLKDNPRLLRVRVFPSMAFEWYVQRSTRSSCKLRTRAGGSGRMASRRAFSRSS